MNNEIKRIIFDEEFYTEANYPFTIETNFSNLGSIVQISPQGPIIGFVFDDSIGNLLGLNETIFWEEYNTSPNPVEIISLDNIFTENDIANGMIFKSKRTGMIFNFTLDVNPGY